MQYRFKNSGWNRKKMEWNLEWNIEYKVLKDGIEIE